MKVYCDSKNCYYASKEGFCENESICMGYEHRCECYTQSEEVLKMVCPNGCNSNFATTGHVIQEWEVDAFGNFVEVLNDCLETTHDADFDNIWTCTKCGAEGVVTVEKRIIPQQEINYE